ncbi:MAG: glucose-6-phosphate dehydrogenase (NADP(+)) [Chitinivibrionales bacterium]|nr:glucose-6-phosphate dehydrogenase (NADP(+)) [Chitinivibrionales bacterium]
MSEKISADNSDTYAIIIIGATGDLSQKKLIPALIMLHARNLLHPNVRIIGVGRSVMSHEQFRNRFAVSEPLSPRMFYHQNIAGLKQFVQSIGEFRTLIIFMALPPAIYGNTAKELAVEGFGEQCRIVIEKPFGYDLSSAQQLNKEINSFFPESQIYRIDHYLAKEAVQNILVFRFANVLFSHLWNNLYIEMIQINAFEDDRVGKRGSYFDKAGIIRDMVQNHLLQLVCLLCMEEPASLDAEDIRQQKINVLKCIRVSDACRFQYDGYREEEAVAADSPTETYAEIRLFIDNFRWSGVPIYIRTGKALTRKGTEIGIVFKSYPPILFNANHSLEQNKIIFKIQPSEGIIVDISNKVPGGGMQITSTNMLYCYRDNFSQQIPEAYQRLLMDVIGADKTLFVDALETELAWKCIDPILKGGPLHTYVPGTTPRCQLGVPWIDFEKYTSLCLP